MGFDDSIRLDCTPTKHKAKCKYCKVKLSENLPRLYAFIIVYGHQSRMYLCDKCALVHVDQFKTNYKYSIKLSTSNIKKYKSLLKTKYIDAVAVEEL